MTTDFKITDEIVILKTTKQEKIIQKWRIYYRYLFWYEIKRYSK